MVKDNLDEFKIPCSFKFQESGDFDYIIINVQSNLRLRSTTYIKTSLKPLYETKLPITAMKYKYLKNISLKKIIPEKYQAEYLFLSFKSTIFDNFPETDERYNLDDTHT